MQIRKTVMSSWRLVLSLHAKKTTNPICMNINEEKPEDKPPSLWFTKTSMFRESEGYIKIFTDVSKQRKTGLELFILQG